MTFAGIAIGTGLALGAGASIYGSVTQAGIAGQQNALAMNQQSKQNLAFNQLQQLLSDPGSFLSNPLFTSTLNAGSSAVAHQNAAAFGPNSGGEGTALQTFGQSLASSQLLGQEELLAGMSGTGFNPSTALSGAAGGAAATTANLSSLSGLLAFFGNSGGAGGGGGAAGGNGAGLLNNLMLTS